MRCPNAATRDTRVVDSRDLDEARRSAAGGSAPLHLPVHDLRAGRSRPADRAQARRHPPGVRPGQARGRASRRRSPAGRSPRTPPSGPRTPSRPSCARRASPRSRLARRCARDGAAARDRPHRVHPVRRRSTRASRTSRTSSARWIAVRRGVAPKKARRRGMSVLADRDIRAELEAGRVRIDPYDPSDLQPSSVDLHLDRSVPRVPQQPLRVHRPAPAAAGPDRAAGDRGRRAVHPAPGRVRAGPDARVGRAARRPVARLEGKSSLGPARVADPFDGRLCRPGLEGHPHARALERRQPADRPLRGHADRTDQLLPDELPVERPYGSRSSGRSTRASRSRPHRPSTPTSTGAARRRPRRRARPRHSAMRATGAPTSAAGHGSRSCRPARSAPTPARSSGRCHGSCGVRGRRASSTRTGACSKRSTAS